VTLQPKTIVIPRAEIESLVTLTSRVGAVREALRTADDATAARIVDAVRAALVERIEHDELRLSAAALIVSATA
jgi:formaldehyde-activating enzyme involved in methanogenesis